MDFTAEPILARKRRIKELTSYVNTRPQVAAKDGLHGGADPGEEEKDQGAHLLRQHQASGGCKGWTSRRSRSWRGREGSRSSPPTSTPGLRWLQRMDFTAEPILARKRRIKELTSYV